MDEKRLDEENPQGRKHEASIPRDADQRDDLTDRRSEQERLQLTNREREERWPIG